MSHTFDVRCGRTVWSSGVVVEVGEGWWVVLTFCGGEIEWSVDSA